MFIVFGRLNVACVRPHTFHGALMNLQHTSTDYRSHIINHSFSEQPVLRDISWPSDAVRGMSEMFRYANSSIFSPRHCVYDSGASTGTVNTL